MTHDNSNKKLIPVYDKGEIAALAALNLKLVDVIMRPPEFSAYVIYESSIEVQRALKDYRSGKLQVSAKEMQDCLIWWDHFLADECSYIQSEIDNATKTQSYLD